MKKVIYVFCLIVLPLFSISATNEFYYDKNELSTQFSKIEEISLFVEQNDVNYTELSKNPIYNTSLQLTNNISVKPNLKFDELDWGAFAWGFCCFPIGIFTVLINDNKDQNSKNSFWAGFGVSIITSTVSYVGLYAYFIFSFGVIY